MDAFASRPREELLSLVQQQADLTLFLQQELLALRQEIQRLKNGDGDSPPPALKPDLPCWVKPNVAPPAEKPARKPRSQAFVRHRETLTEEVLHTCSHCPDCGRTLSGGTQYSRRQILELPQITVRVVDYVLPARYCGVCQKRCVSTPDLAEVAVGSSRFGQRVHALVTVAWGKKVLPRVTNCCKRHSRALLPRLPEKAIPKTLNCYRQTETWATG